MDSDDIDEKIAEVGSSIFDKKTRKWLVDILTQHHYKSGETESPMNMEKISSIISAGGEGEVKEAAGYAAEESCPLDLMVYTLGHVVSNGTLMIPSQSTILSFAVTYKLQDKGEEIFNKNLIVKLIDDEEGEVEFTDENSNKSHQDFYNSAICEFNFYTKIVPEIESWASSRGVSFKFGIPTCISGKYISGIHSRHSPLLFDSLSTLVLVDLVETNGYGMENPGPEGLALEELQLAVREIGKIHAVSWAFQECIGQNLLDKYKNYFEDLTDVATNFAEDIEDSFPELEAFLRERGGNVALNMKLLDKLSRLLPIMLETIKKLLIPSDGIIKNISFVHLNYWHQNILFKNETDKPKLCRILDWENVNVTQPMIDVACILLRSATPTMRREHLDQLLELYTKTFQTTAQCLNMPTVLDFNYFKAQYQNVKSFPIFMMMGTMSLTLCDDVAMELFMEGLMDLDSEGFL